jgi:hypothetical protein
VLGTSFHCECRMGMAAGAGVLNGKLLKGRGIGVGVGGVWHARDKPSAPYFLLLGVGSTVGQMRRRARPLDGR